MQFQFLVFLACPYHSATQLKDTTCFAQGWPSISELLLINFPGTIIIFQLYCECRTPSSTCKMDCMTLDLHFVILEESKATAQLCILQPLSTLLFVNYKSTGFSPPGRSA